jgi:outer membrane receptor protein involved in Fe transport
MRTLAFVLAAVTAADVRAQDLDDVAAPRAVVVDVSPQDTTVVTGDELVRRGFRTLGDALAYELGVVRTRTGRGLEYALFGVPAGIALVIDGVPAVVDGERDVLDVDELINLADVERVEISRGPATALVGAGALVGVVRVTTRKPGVTGAAVRGGGTVFVDGTSNAARVGGGEKELAAEGTLRDGDLGARDRSDRR